MKAKAVSFVLVAAGTLMIAAACVPLPPDTDSPPTFNNTTDRTNQGASYVGSAACRACHPSIGQTHALHGHAHILTRIEGQPPDFPAMAHRAGVPDPPPGLLWTDISYVIGGYSKKAVFVDLDGFLVTTGSTGTPAQWNLPFPANGTEAGFVEFESAPEPEPYDISCFVCHTTGPKPQNPDEPRFQENRPGIAGAWAEPGVQCEGCHGPGSNHIPNPAARNLFVSAAAAECGQCHTRQGPDTILAADGFIESYQQWSELRASGGHASFDCTFCHDPHASSTYDRDNGIRNDCTDCHSDRNMALHENATFMRGDYAEALTCQSCHMPFATKSASSATGAVVGPTGRMGDTRTHIFRISTEQAGLERFFNDAGTAVRRDAEGQGAVTVDFVCLRCHNGVGNAFEIDTVGLAAQIAIQMHARGD